MAGHHHLILPALSSPLRSLRLPSPLKETVSWDRFQNVGKNLQNLAQVRDSAEFKIFWKPRWFHNAKSVFFAVNARLPVCVGLKGQCHKIFCFWFFSWISLPPATEYPFWTVSNFFENSRRYSQGKVHHRYQRHRWQIFLPFSLALLIPAANLPPVSTIPAANLPPVSTTPVANCHRYQRHRRQICHRCRWHRWQIMATISGCRHLKVNLKAKIYIYVNSTTQRCPNKII